MQYAEANRSAENGLFHRNLPEVSGREGGLKKLAIPSDNIIAIHTKFVVGASSRHLSDSKFLVWVIKIGSLVGSERKCNPVAQKGFYTSMEKEITSEKIEIGCEIAVDVVNKFGKVLIPANTIFEAKHRHILKTWGIKTVKIKTEFMSASEIVITHEQREEALKNLKQRMLWEPRNAHENDLQEIAVQKICLKNL